MDGTAFFFFFTEFISHQRKQPSEEVGVGWGRGLIKGLKARKPPGYFGCNFKKSPGVNGERKKNEKRRKKG